jgi:hypothetical protein
MWVQVSIFHIIFELTKYFISVSVINNSQVSMSMPTKNLDSDQFTFSVPALNCNMQFVLADLAKMMSFSSHA